MKIRQAPPEDPARIGKTRLDQRAARVLHRIAIAAIEQVAIPESWSQFRYEAGDRLCSADGAITPKASPRSKNLAVILANFEPPAIKRDCELVRT